MAFIMVMKAEFAKLRVHHLEALRYLFGRQWGYYEGLIKERRGATWALLVVNLDVREVCVSALLWLCT